MNYNWNKLSDLSRNELTSGRKMIHQAVQLPALAGRCLNTADPDDKTAALHWLDDKKLLVSQLWEGNNHRASLSISELQIKILDKNNDTVSMFSINGKSYNDCFDLLQKQIDQLGYGGERLSKDLPYKIPDYKFSDDSTFEDINKKALIELENYYSNANLVLNKIKGKFNSSEILCWPHHFDIATSFTERGNSSREQSNSIGIGMSPGDESYNQPYFYVSPWPYPEKKEMLPAPGTGKWHTENWFGAVLTADKIINSENQFNITTEFINSAISILKNNKA